MMSIRDDRINGGDTDGCFGVAFGIVAVVTAIIFILIAL